VFVPFQGDASLCRAGLCARGQKPEREREALALRDRRDATAWTLVSMSRENTAHDQNS
jgi:hypothetical protein